VSVHRYAGAGTCIYCDAPTSEAGNGCALAARIERDYTDRHPGNSYDPVQHLRSLVGRLRARRAEDWTLEECTTSGVGAPQARYVVRRAGIEVLAAEHYVLDLAARWAVARVWPWAMANRCDR
jgi:hypothetical protein